MTELFGIEFSSVGQLRAAYGAVLLLVVSLVIAFGYASERDRDS